MGIYSDKAVWLKKIHEPQFDVLPDKTIRELIVKAQNGCEESRDKVVHANLRLVVQVLNKDIQCPSYLWMDCVSEGNIVLIKTIDKYKTDSNAKYSSLAGNMLRWRLWAFISQQENAVKIPEGRRRKMRKKENDEWYEEGMIDEFDKVDKPISTNYMVPVIHGHELPVSTEQSEAMSRVLKQDRKQLISHCLECLDEKEKIVIINRWLGEDKGTLEEVSKIIGRTKERVRQIDKIALGKLRAAIWKQELEEKFNLRLDKSTTKDKVRV
jgi:RNA polymerase sigma factor (sigma-70 family)